MSPEGHLPELPGAEQTNDPTPGGLKQQNGIISQFWRLGFCGPAAGRATLPLRVSGGPFLPPPEPGGCQRSQIIDTSSISASVVTWPLCVGCRPPSSVPAVRSGTHCDPGWCQPEVLTQMTSSATLGAKTSTFWAFAASRCGHTWTLAGSQDRLPGYNPASWPFLLQGGDWGHALCRPLSHTKLLIDVENKSAFR